LSAQRSPRGVHGPLARAQLRGRRRHPHRARAGRLLRQVPAQAGARGRADRGRGREGGRMTALSATTQRLATASTEDGRSDKRDWLLEELTAGVAELTTSDRWQRFLDVQARFTRYSFLNTLAIHLQRPDATRVAGFHTWRGLGRRVCKGEKGIAILAPVVRRVRVEDEDG